MLRARRKRRRRQRLNRPALTAEEAEHVLGDEQATGTADVSARAGDESGAAALGVDAAGARGAGGGEEAGADEVCGGVRAARCGARLLDSGKEHAGVCLPVHLRAAAAVSQAGGADERAVVEVLGEPTRGDGSGSLRGGGVSVGG